MSEGATQLEAEHSTKAAGKLCLLTLDGLDGRTSAVRRIREFEAQITADLGGSVTIAQESLMRRASVLSALLDDKEAHWASGTPLTLNDYCSATNVLRRLLTTLGIERKQRPVDGSPVLLGEN